MSKTHSQFIKELKDVNPDIQVVEQYSKSTDRIQVKCKKCGLIWNPKAYSLLQGKSCPHCSAIEGAKNNKGKTGLKNQDAFLLQLNNIHPDIIAKGEYVNTHTDITFYCNRCGNKWKAKPYSVLQGHGCPRCSNSGTSFMEQFIRLCFVYVLGSENVLSRDRTLIGIELDILIPNLKIAIEPGNWYLHKNSIDRDYQKREKCRKQGVRLITIYDKFPVNEKMPFDEDCLIFTDDLNKSDHRIIYDLVKTLFETCGISYTFSLIEYENIEREAYKMSKSKNHESFVEEMKKIHPNISILGRYYNSNKRIMVKCNICGTLWNAVPSNLLSGDGCKKCGTKVAHRKFTKSTEEFIEQLRDVNPFVEIVGEYTGRHNPVKTRCKICGYTWLPRASSLLRGSNHKGSKTIHKRINDEKTNSGDID